MITSELLRKSLLAIFGIPESHLVPISNNWFIPTAKREDKSGDWIGYRILSKEPYARAVQNAELISKPYKVRFRLSFIGPQAEEWSDQTMLWEDRTDVTQVFNDLMEAQINYNSRTNFTYPVRHSGFNDDLCWVVDFSAQTFYKIDIKRVPWITGY